MTLKEKQNRMKRQPGEVKCQGCGIRLDPKGDLSEIEYIKTKRGTEIFFHTRCRDLVWQRKIV